MPPQASAGRVQLDLGSRASVAKNAFHLVLGQVSTTALAIVFSAALGRSLGARDFGLYFLINSFSTFAYVVVDWGQQFYVIREVARAPESSGRLLGSTLVLRVAGAIVISLPAGLLAWALGYDARTCWFSVAFIAATVPWAATQSYLMMFRGRERMGLEASVSVVNKIATLLLALPALALGMGVGGVVAAQGLAGVGAFAVATWLHRRIATGETRFDATTARQVLAGGTAIVTMMIAASIQPYLDAIILSKIVPGDAVGWYGAAKNIMGTLIAPSLIIGAAAYPRLSRAASDMPTFNAEVRATLRPMLFLGALAGVGTWLCADSAIALVYGQRNFGPAGMILKVFAPGLFLLFIDVLFGNALTALGRSTAFSIAKIASVVLSTGLDLVLIPWFQQRTGNGGIGAVVAFVASEVVVFGGSALFLPRGCLGAAVAVDIGRALGAGGLTALLFHWLPPLPIYVGAPACVVVFALCALALGLVRRADVTLLQTLVRRRVPAPAAIVQTNPGSPAA
jgi:O-antigen/teichoic acid export membrane protein